jgi:hypothetical protein
VQVETAHDHTVIKTFSDYRSKRGGARQPDYGDERDEDWSETRTRRTGGRGKKEVKEVKAEVVAFAGEGERFLIRIGFCVGDGFSPKNTGHSLLAGSSSKGRTSTTVSTPIAALPYRSPTPHSYA